jgi:ferric-dicitrate binding protein FerR (iron transport regulator)
MGIGRACSTLAIGLGVVSGPAVAVAQSCGPNGVEIGRRQDGNNIIVDCQCAPGYVKGPNGCVRAGSASDADAAARPSEISATGDVVFALADGRRVDAEAALTESMSAGTRIATGRDSSARIVFRDGSVLRLGELTLFGIQVPRGLQPFAFSLIRGHMQLTEIGYHNGRVRTPTAVAAVRGTDFSIDVGNDRSEVTLRSGIVDIEDPSGRVLVTLRPNQTVSIASDGTVGTPRAAD